MLPDGHRLVRFLGATAEEAMARFGRLPLPPYITRAPTEHDEVRYQTVYAERKAAWRRRPRGCTSRPICWTRSRASGVLIAGLDLEVGPGTFKPVEEDDPGAHPMHPERYDIIPGWPPRAS